VRPDTRPRNPALGRKPPSLTLAIVERDDGNGGALPVAKLTRKIECAALGAPENLSSEHEDDALTRQQTLGMGFVHAAVARRAPNSPAAPSRRNAGVTGTE